MSWRIFTAITAPYLVRLASFADRVAMMDLSQCRRLRRLWCVLPIFGDDWRHPFCVPRSVLCVLQLQPSLHFEPSLSLLLLELNYVTPHAILEVSDASADAGLDCGLTLLWSVVVPEAAGLGCALKQ